MSGVNFFDFILSPDEVSQSPSRKAGIDEETERNLRIYGCELIQEAGILLKLPQVVMARAQVLFHRFYYRQSMTNFDVKMTAMASIFLSTKLEEHIRFIKDIINIFDHIIYKREGPYVTRINEVSENFIQVKDQLVLQERHMLKELGFVLHVDHPHKFFLIYFQILETGDNNLAQVAWNYLNDSLRTNLCVRYEPSLIASGAIFLAARKLGIPLPEQPPWWELFDATKPQLLDIASTIQNLYELPRVEYIDVSGKNPTPKLKPPTPPPSEMPENIEQPIERERNREKHKQYKSYSRSRSRSPSLDEKSHDSYERRRRRRHGRHSRESSSSSRKRHRSYDYDRDTDYKRRRYRRHHRHSRSPSGSRRRSRSRSRSRRRERRSDGHRDRRSPSPYYRSRSRSRRRESPEYHRRDRRRRSSRSHSRHRRDGDGDRGRRYSSDRSISPDDRYYKRRHSRRSSPRYRRRDDSRSPPIPKRRHSSSSTSSHRDRDRDKEDDRGRRSSRSSSHNDDNRQSSRRRD